MRVILAIFVSLSLLIHASVNAADTQELLRDDYSTAKHPARKAQRGNWEIVDSMATVKQEDELYKKYQNHGPIMVKGQHATVKIGDKTFEVQHARIAQEKSIVKLGFSFGELAIREFKLDAI